MIYLALEILTVCGINLSFAFAKKRGYDNLHFTIFNYITASAVSACQLGAKLMAGQERCFESGITWKLAIVTGFLYLLCFLLQQDVTFKYGPSVNAMFTRLAMIVSVLFSVIVFKESAGILRWIGFALAIVCLFVYSYAPGMKVDTLPLILLLVNGSVQIVNNLFAKLCPAADKPFFMSLVYFVALVFAVAENRRRNKGKEIKRSEILFGIVLGTLNLLAASFQLMALRLLPATLVFPTASVSIILLTAALGKLFFAEKFDKKALASFGIAVVSLVLLNI